MYVYIICNIHIQSGLFNSTVVRIKSLRVARMRNTISGCGKASRRNAALRRGDLNSTVVQDVSHLSLLLFQFQNSSSRQYRMHGRGAFVSGIYLRQSRGVKKKRAQRVTRFRDFRTSLALSSATVAFITGNGADIELIHYPD